MTKSQTLRKWLYDNGFYVTKRTLPVKTEVLFIRLCRLLFIGGKPDYHCDDRYLYGGRVSDEDESGRAYLKMQANRLKTAGIGMLKSLDKKEQGEVMLKAAEVLLRGV